MLTALRLYTQKFRLFSHNAWMVLTYSALTGLAFGVFQLLLNFYILSLGGYTERFVGNLTSVQSLASLFMALPAVYLVQRFPQKRIMVATGWIGALAFLGLVLLPYRFFLILFSFIQGLTTSVRQVAIAPFLMDNTGDEERQYVFSLNFGLMTLAQFVGAQLGGHLPTWLGGLVGAAPTDALAYRLALGSMMLVMLLSLIPLMRLRTTLTAPSGPITLPWVQLWRYGGQLTRFLIPQIIIGLGAGLMQPFMNLYFRHVYGRSDAAIGNLFALGALGMALAQFVGAPLAGRLGKIGTVMLSQALSIPFLLLLGAGAWIVPAGGNVTIWFVIAAVAFLFRLSLMNLGNPVYQTFVLEQIPRGGQAIATSLNSISFLFGWAIMPSVSGWLQATYGEFGFVPVFGGVSFFYATALTLEYLFFRQALYRDLRLRHTVSQP